MSTLYISPTGSGLRDGSSAANAGTLSSLSKFIANAGAGGEVLLLADQGAYQQSSQITIAAGGAVGAPVTIRGVDCSGNPMQAQIVGSRAENWTPGQNEGSELFRLMSGANNLHFEDISAKNIGNGVFRIGADISNLSIDNVDAANVTRFIQDYVSGANATASVHGLDVKNVTVSGFSKEAIYLAYDSSNVRIENVTGDSQQQSGGLYIVGVHLDGTVHDVTLENVAMNNSRGSGGSTDYWNGDGFATEGGVYNVLFLNTTASGNSDAGYDIKSSNTVLDGTTADGNNRNYRFWSDSITLIDGTSVNPTHAGGSASMAHVWLANGALVDIQNFTFSDSGTPKTLFDLLQGGATLTVEGTEISDIYAALIKLYKDSTVDIAPVVHAPTEVTISNCTIDENALAGSVVGKLAAVDRDAADSHSFALIGGATDKFSLLGDQIVVKAGAVLDYETKNGFDLIVRATDQTGLSVDQTLHINLRDVVETGTSGDDALVGGSGSDILCGLAGNDTYMVNVAGDVVVETATGGVDTIQTSLASYALGANLENLTYTGSDGFAGFGNALNNVITGGARDDTLSGGSGTDTMTGGAGNDTIHGDLGGDSISGGDGNDFIFGDGQNDYLSGDNGNDQLFGGANNDYLYGGAGNDLLDGGANTDRMSGGTGDDTYVVDSATDVVTENAGEGTDTVQTNINYQLGANVENLQLTGSGAINGTGNALHNLIVGNDGDNILMGGAGNDTLDGGKGRDLLIGGEGHDTYLFGLGSGQDTIDNTQNSDGADVLRFKDGINALDLWFSEDGGDLVINVVGTGDSARLTGWYGNVGHQVDHIELANGAQLDAGSVQQVVDAMAGAAAAAPTSLNNLHTDQHDAVVAAVAASWH